MDTDTINLRVVGVAIRLTHANGYELVLTLPAPNRHSDILSAGNAFGILRESFNGREKQGFILSDGRFATREQAWAVARRAGQIVKRCGGDNGVLFSENLW